MARTELPEPELFDMLSESETMWLLNCLESSFCYFLISESEVYVSKFTAMSIFAGHLCIYYIWSSSSWFFVGCSGKCVLDSLIRWKMWSSHTMESFASYVRKRVNRKGYLWSVTHKSLRVFWNSCNILPFKDSSNLPCGLNIIKNKFNFQIWRKMVHAWFVETSIPNIHKGCVDYVRRRWGRKLFYIVRTGISTGHWCEMSRSKSRNV